MKYVRADSGLGRVDKSQTWPVVFPAHTRSGLLVIGRHSRRDAIHHQEAELGMRLSVAAHIKPEILILSGRVSCQFEKNDGCSSGRKDSHSSHSPADLSKKADRARLR